MKYIIITLILLLIGVFSYFSLKEKVIEKEVSIHYILKHDTTQIIKIKDIDHYRTKTVYVKASMNRLLLDSIAKLNNIKPNQIQSVSNEVIKVQGVAEGQFIDVFGDNNEREYKFSDSFIKGFAICDSDSIRLQYEGQFKLYGTLFWKYNHKFPILRKLWDSKSYIQDFYTDNKNIKVDSIFSLQIKKE